MPATIESGAHDGHSNSASASNPGLRSNIENWKRLQEGDYFENHPCYNGLRDFDDSTCSLVEGFLPLKPEMNVVVIGCGYGRETAHIAPKVRHVFGIDVSQTILAKAERYLGARGIHNFTPVLAEEYDSAIPDGVDLVFSIVVMQHLTRDLVRDHFTTLGRKLTPTGVQFVEDFMAMEDDATEDPATLRTYEASISWTSRQILELSRACGLKFVEVRTTEVTPTAIGHFSAPGTPRLLRPQGATGKQGRFLAALLPITLSAPPRERSCPLKLSSQIWLRAVRVS
jgi:SAM-dependent methyltransferase